MATRKRAKRYDAGGDIEVVDRVGKPVADIQAEEESAFIDEQSSKRDAEKVRMDTDRGEAMLKSMRDKPTAPVVTKEQLAKSGMTLREYMNNQQGLKPRNAAKDEMSTVAKDRAAAYKKADAAARTPEGRAERQKQIEGQAVERVTPEANLLPVGSLKTLAAVAKGMAGRHAAKGSEKLAEYSTPILEMAKRRIGTEPLKLGMKKGGAVKSAPKSSSASRRADGIATKGKTRGRYL